MSNVEEKLAKSLTAESTDLIPYLPYLLQDLWDLGSIPECVAAVLKQHALMTKQARVLDLACGKGAVSIHLQVGDINEVVQHERDMGTVLLSHHNM